MASTEDDGELATLKALITSDGWGVFVQLVEQEWGAVATLTKIDAALKAIPRGEAEAVTDTVTQIQAARREVLKVLQMPKDRVATLTPKESASGRFASLRRVSR